MNRIAQDYGRTALLLGVVGFGLSGIFALVAGRMDEDPFIFPGMGMLVSAVGVILLALAFVSLLVRRALRPRDSGAAPPADTGSIHRAGLFSTRSMALATAIGSAPAGLLLLAFNYRQLGQERTARLSVFLALVSAIVVVAMLPYFLRIRTMLLFLGAAQIVLMALLAEIAQGKAIREHRGAGGLLSSEWKAVGVGILTAAALVGIHAVRILLTAGRSARG